VEEATYSQQGVKYIFRTPGCNFVSERERKKERETKREQEEREIRDYNNMKTTFSRRSGRRFTLVSPELQRA